MRVRAPAHIAVLILLLLLPVAARGQQPIDPGWQQPSPGWQQAPPMVAPPPPPMMTMPAGIVVDLRADDPAATLYQLTGATPQLVFFRRGARFRYVGTWSPVCRMPCGVPVHPNGVFKIDGRRLVPSASFELPSMGRVSLDVSAGHDGPRAGGIVLTAFGGMATVVGIVLTSVAVGIGNDAGDGPSPGFLTAGLATLTGGVLMLAGGITLIVLSRTTVHTSDGFRLAAGGRASRFELTAGGLRF